MTEYHGLTGFNRDLCFLAFWRFLGVAKSAPSETVRKDTPRDSAQLIASQLLTVCLHIIFPLYMSLCLDVHFL